MSLGLAYVPQKIEAEINATMFLALEFLGAVIVCAFLGCVIDMALSAIGARVIGKQSRSKHTVVNKAASHAELEPQAPSLPSSADIAKAVHEHANIAYYQSLISAVEGAMLTAGFKFANKRTAEVQLPYSVLLKAADALSMARTEFMQPYIEPDRLNQRVEWDREDGYSLRFVTTIIDAMRSSGRYVQLLAEADCWVAVDDYASNGLTESAVSANGTAQIHIRSK
ncbi:hypothetical protein [Burkholderia ubonensis]|uniref:hypothetical protein n=1 Tax=Burkholderia ubonensis TaxID=101571 RepID=UPI002AAF5A27|nr:hypothetical protein [Burkholderia ubonensis]